METDMVKALGQEWIFCIQETEKKNAKETWALWSKDKITEMLEKERVRNCRAL